MYLESFTIKNYRKFGERNNTVQLVASAPIDASKDSSKSLIAPSSTLVIGKNNSGKTTIAKALSFICSKKMPKAADFNLDYLKSLLTDYRKVIKENNSLDNLPLPELSFILRIKTNINDTGDDLINNIGEFLSIESDTDIAEIFISYTVAEEKVFKEKIQNILKKDSKLNKQTMFFYDLLNSEDVGFKKRFFNSSDETVENVDLNNILNIEEIEANRSLKEGILSDIFKNIVKFQFIKNNQHSESLGKKVKQINNIVTNAVSPKEKLVSLVLQEIDSKDHVSMGLSGNVDMDVILEKLVRYSFAEGENFIPEDQFGLGYINLLNIIGKIIHYIDNYEAESYKNQVNLLFIDEPEAFMHPQMQEFFINRIDKAVNRALCNVNEKDEITSKSLHCQLVITTHSSHIVNSKIQSSNSFDNINYLTSPNKTAHVINLTDKLLSNQQDLVGYKNLKFIKKHIKYKVSELFFSDAVIFVEGVTEDSLLKYYLDKNESLRNYYISVINIDGAHGNIYFNLINALEIPCLIITDIDIKRAKCERGEEHARKDTCEICGQIGESDSQPFEQGSKPIYKQITDIKKCCTTNETIKSFNLLLKNGTEKNKDKLGRCIYFHSDNLYVVYQKDAIEGVYPTSLEEAFILTNYQNSILNNTLIQCIPDIYKNVVGEDTNLENLITNSYKLYKKLSNKKKSEFTNTLLYECITCEEVETPRLPKYIMDGFSWLKKQLEPKNLSKRNKASDRK